MPLLPDNIPAEERRAAVLSLTLAIVLFAAKFFAFLITGSAAIFSDALETIVNVAASAIAIYSLWVAHTPADQEHPYGHGKIEFFAGGFEGGMIFLASILTIGQAIRSLIYGGLQQQNLVAGIVLLLIALALNGVVGVYLMRVGGRSGSVTLVADGKHLLSDALTSVFAIIALILVRLTGKEWADPVVAIGAAIYIAGIGVALMRHSAAGLMDRQEPADQELLAKILDSHVGTSGKSPTICSYHKVRHRHSGRYHWVDFHIVVPPQMTVQEGHDVASTIELEIEQALGEGNATAHIEPCKTADCALCTSQRAGALSHDSVQHQ